MEASTTRDSLLLVPEATARVALAGRLCSLRVLAPDYVAVGVGELRLLRIREGADGLELVAGYESYDRAAP